MKTQILLSIVGCLLAGTLLADSAVDRTVKPRQQEEVTVFVTGSLIPKRVKLQRTGTRTTSPIRVIDRNEIDQTAHPTTAGAMINDPSVRVIGH